MVRKSFEVPEGEGYANYYRVLLHHYLYPTLNWKNITKNITAYSNKWLHFGNNGSAGPDSASNGQRVKYKNPVTLDGALFVDYCHDGSSSLVVGPATVSMSNNIIIGRSQRVSFVSEGHLDILQSLHNNIYFHTTVSSSLLLSLVTLCQ